jgi:hypothetical protein
MKNLNKILLGGGVALMLSAPMAQVRAGGMTCSDYDKPDIYAYASCLQNDPSLTNFEADTGISNCCAELAAFKAVCDLHGVHVESHKAASDMLKSDRDMHEWAKDYKACVHGAIAGRDAAFPKAMAPRSPGR